MPIHNLFYLVKGQINPNGLRNIGPRVRVEIQIPPILAEYFTQRGQPVPEPFSGDALFDTGASISAVDNSAITNLGINPMGVTQVHTPGGTVQQNLYPLRFFFPTLSNLTIDFNAVIGSELRSQGIIALVGRDVLSRCMLVYNGLVGICTISF